MNNMTDQDTRHNKIVICVDIGGTSLRAALWDGQHLIERRECATPTPAVPTAVLKEVLELISSLVAAVAVSGTSGTISGIGVACSGVVVRAGQLQDSHVTSINRQNFPEWIEIPLAQQLSAALDMPCIVLNDARSAAWSEYQRGAGRGSAEFMFMTISTGVGAGLVLDGRLHLARNGLDTELGWVQVPVRPVAFGLSGTSDAADSETVNVVDAMNTVTLSDTLSKLSEVGTLNALELESSGTTLDRAAERLDLTDARQLCDAAEAGNAQALGPYQRSAGLVAWKIADCAALLGLDRVALGGSVGLRDGYLAQVVQNLQELPELFCPQVVHAQLGADAGLIGAGLWMQQLLDE